MSSTIVFLLLYFSSMLMIGLWAMRRGAGSSLEEYMLGGRQVGPLVTALTLQSTSMSGYMFLGAGSLSYTQGYWSYWFAAGDIGGGVLNLSVIGRRMRKLSQLLGALTSIEYLEKRYPSRWVRMIGASLSVFLLFFYVLAQFIAGGKGLEMVTGLPYAWSLLIAVAVIIMYTFMGGYAAVAYTDLVQALIMVVGVMWVLFAALDHVGGPVAAHAALAELDPTLLSIWGRDLENEGQWGIVVGAFFVFSIGYMGWPHVVTRHMAMSSPLTARKAGVYSTIWNLMFVTAPYFIGLLAILIVPNIADPEMAIFATAEALLPPAVVGIVMAAIMAAIMSTADSLLLQTGSIASRDIYQRFINPDMSERQMVWVSRLIVLVMGTCGYAIALLQPPGIFTIVIFTTTVLGSAFLPAYVAAVWWKKANTPGAISSMLMGAGSSFLWELLDMSASTGLHPMLVGVVCSCVSMVSVSLLTQQRYPVPDYILEAMDESASLRALPAHLLNKQDFSLSGEAKQLRPA